MDSGWDGAASDLQEGRTGSVASAEKGAMRMDAALGVVVSMARAEVVRSHVEDGLVARTLVQIANVEDLPLRLVELLAIYFCPVRTRHIAELLGVDESSMKTYRRRLAAKLRVSGAASRLAVWRFVLRAIEGIPGGTDEVRGDDRVAAIYTVLGRARNGRVCAARAVDRDLTLAQSQVLAWVHYTGSDEGTMKTVMKGRGVTRDTARNELAALYRAFDVHDRDELLLSTFAWIDHNDR